MRFGFWEILLIVALVFLLFGANKFPAMMKNLAEGMKIFKKEVKDDCPKTSAAPALKAAPAKKPSKKPAKKTAKKKK